MTSITQKLISSIDIVNPKYKILVYTALGATCLATGAVFAPWQAVKIVGMAVLTGVTYGIVNDMIACRDCIEYFTVGHRYHGKELSNRLIKTLNPNLNAIAWGMCASWQVCTIAGLLLAAVARAPFPGLTSKISAVQLAPYLAVTAALTIIFAHIKSRQAQKKMAEIVENVENPEFNYTGVPIDLQAGWEACSVRNFTSYAAVALGGSIISIGVIAARSGLFSMLKNRLAHF